MREDIRDLVCKELMENLRLPKWYACQYRPGRYDPTYPGTPDDPIMPALYIYRKRSGRTVVYVVPHANGIEVGDFTGAPINLSYADPDSLDIIQLIVDTHEYMDRRRLGMIMCAAIVVAISLLVTWGMVKCR